MAKYPVTPGLRKKRICLDSVLLLGCLTLLLLALDFPILTANQALAATQERHFFGPGRIIGQLEFPHKSNEVKGGQYDRYYILEHEDWYAWCGVNHYGLFWQSGELDAVKNDPSVPLVPLVVSNWANGAVLVICNDPSIVQVELRLRERPSWKLFTFKESQAADHCFVIRYQIETMPWEGEFQLRGYDAAGKLVYESAAPESWTEYEARLEEVLKEVWS